MSELLPPLTIVEVMGPVFLIGIGIALMLAILGFIFHQLTAILGFIFHQLTQQFDRQIRFDRDRLDAATDEWIAQLKAQREKPKLKNDDLEFEGEDYFEDDDYASFEELLAEKPKRKNDDYE